MTRCKPFNTAALLVAPALLAGCAADTDRYPSLAIRDVERVSGTFEVAEGDPAPAPT